MIAFWSRLASLGALAGLASCGAAPAGDEKTDLSQLSVVEVTTVTTVQGSGGLFLSPRPQQLRPSYVASGESAAAPSAPPSLQAARAKMDTALLFRAPNGERFQLEARLSDVDPQHYFPKLTGDSWPIELLGESPRASPVEWTEWEGWRAFATASVRGAAAATLDYERLGGESPLVLNMADESEAELPVEEQTLVVSNRSEMPVGEALLVYSHAGGIGVKVVGQIQPGRGEMTATGPKERPPNQLLDEARAVLAGFLQQQLGAELAAAVSRAKSVPFLETHGLRLIYLLSEEQAPAAIGLSAELGERRRVLLAHAEVLPFSEEAHVLQLLSDEALAPSDAPERLGRFTRAKLEVAQLNGSEEVRGEAEQLLRMLAE